MSALAIIFHEAVVIKPNATKFSFTVADAINPKLVINHCNGNENLHKYLLNYKYEIWIPNSVFNYSKNKKLILLHDWFYDKIREDLFMTIEMSNELNIKQVTFGSIIRKYLCKNF